VLASAWEHDLLVLARRSQPSGPALVSRLGSAVKTILESSRAPVLLLPERAVRLPDAPPLFRTVLAAVDFSDSSPAVAELARRLGGPPARLVLLHVLRDFPGEYAHGLHHFAPAGLEAERKSVAAGGLERLDRGERVERIVRSGAPAHEIARLAGRLPADLVVLGRPSRSRTVSQVARTSRCPLLVVPPRRPARGAWFGSGPRDRPRGSRAVE
jgi:nucleotide-binding universal stress UspA family protein